MFKFNVQNAYGSIIGNFGHAVIDYDITISDMESRIAADTSPDKTQMEELLSLLKEIVHGRTEPKKGILSKFIELMQRQSWLSSAVASALFSRLLGSVC